MVIPNPRLLPHMTTIIKQHGALLAKGRLLGIQFDELFKNHLYNTIGHDAITYANQIRQACKRAGLPLYFENPTNQIFLFGDKKSRWKNSLRKWSTPFWEKYDDELTVIRFATSWSTQKEDVEALCQVIEGL